KVVLVFRMSSKNDKTIDESKARLYIPSHSTTVTHSGGKKHNCQPCHDSGGQNQPYRRTKRNFKVVRDIGDPVPGNDDEGQVNCTDYGTSNGSNHCDNKSQDSNSVDTEKERGDKVKERDAGSDGMENENGKKTLFDYTDDGWRDSSKVGDVLGYVVAKRGPKAFAAVGEPRRRIEHADRE
ncbi:hypothetical protein C0993_006739, partial [Termitomyces sp. T159_Od127]